MYDSPYMYDVTNAGPLVGRNVCKWGGLLVLQPGRRCATTAEQDRVHGLLTQKPAGSSGQGRRPPAMSTD